MYKYSQLLFSAFNTSEFEVSNSGNTLSSESEPNIAIQIKVDIEPPEEEAIGLSKELLENLGIPSHHIHYKAGLGQNSVERSLIPLVSCLHHLMYQVILRTTNMMWTPFAI